MKPIILCFVGYYLPGFLSGGPIRTIANLVDHLSDEFDIRIITRDRDFSSSVPYQNILIDDWNQVGSARVFYASKNFQNIFSFAKLLQDTPHDILYFNSFFDFKFTGLPLLARKFPTILCKPCLIAPRGEFSRGALSLKLFKKYVYILFVS